MLGMLTSFFTLSFFNNTCALVPSEEISISFTSPASIFEINSEFKSFSIQQAIIN